MRINNKNRILISLMFVIVILFTISPDIIDYYNKNIGFSASIRSDFDRMASIEFSILENQDITKSEIRLLNDHFKMSSFQSIVNDLYSSEYNQNHFIEIYKSDNKLVLYLAFTKGIYDDDFIEKQLLKSIEYLKGNLSEYCEKESIEEYNITFEEPEYNFDIYYFKYFAIRYSVIIFLTLIIFFIVFKDTASLLAYTQIITILIISLIIDYFIIENNFLSKNYYVENYQAWNYFSIEQEITFHNEFENVTQEFNCFDYPQSYKFMKELKEPTEFEMKSFIWWDNPSYKYDKKNFKFIMHTNKDRITLNTPEIIGSISSSYPKVHKRNYYKFLTEDQIDEIYEYYYAGYDLFVEYCYKSGIQISSFGDVTFINNFPNPFIIPFGRIILISILLIYFGFTVKQCKKRAT